MVIKLSLLLRMNNSWEIYTLIDPRTRAPWSRIGQSRSPDTREKMRASFTPERRAKLSMAVKKRRERERIAKSNGEL